MYLAGLSWAPYCGSSGGGGAKKLKVTAMKMKDTSKEPRDEQVSAEISKVKEQISANAKLPADIRVQKLTKLIYDKANESPDGIARLYVTQEVFNEAMDHLIDEQFAQRMGCVSLAPPLAPVAKKAKLKRLVVLPFGWKNPAGPDRVEIFQNNAKEAAYEYAEEQKIKGYHARVLGPMSKAKEAQYFDSNVFFSQLRKPSTPEYEGWAVEVWRLGEFLKYLATIYSQSEMLDVVMDLAKRGGAQQEILHERQRKAATANEARAKRTAKAQRALFVKLRKSYPVEKVSKDWLIREKICKKHPRKTGWGRRTVINNLKGLK